MIARCMICLSEPT